MAAGTMTIEYLGNVIRYTNSSTANDDILIQTDDVSRYDTFMLMSTAGTVDVFVSLDGTNYATAPLSLVDQGATTSDPVVVTAALRCYGFRGKFRKIRIMQNGATNPTAATLLCGGLGG